MHFRPKSVVKVSLGGREEEVIRKHVDLPTTLGRLRVEQTGSVECSVESRSKKPLRSLQQRTGGSAQTQPSSFYRKMCVCMCNIVWAGGAIWLARPYDWAPAGALLKHREERRAKRTGCASLCVLWATGGFWVRAGRVCVCARHQQSHESD